MVVAVRPKCAVRLFEPSPVPRHNLPFSVFPYPDIREAAFLFKRLAVFVLTYVTVITIRDREVLAIHAHVEGSKPRAGVRVGRGRVKSEVGFFVPHRAVCADVGKVVRPDTFKEGRIFGDSGLAPRIGEFSEHFRDLFGFASRYRRLRRASGNTSRQSCAHSNEYNQ